MKIVWIVIGYLFVKVACTRAVTIQIESEPHLIRRRLHVESTCHVWQSRALVARCARP